MTRALAPVEVEVLGEERRHDHARPVVHEPLARELAHPRVDDRVAGPAFLPRVERFGVVGSSRRHAAGSRTTRRRDAPRGSAGRSRASRVAARTARRPRAGRPPARPRAARRSRSAGRATTATWRRRPGRRAASSYPLTTSTHASSRRRASDAPPAITSGDRAPLDHVGERRDLPGVQPGRRRQTARCRHQGTAGRRQPAPVVRREHLVVLAVGAGDDRPGRHDGGARVAPRTGSPPRGTRARASSRRCAYPLTSRRQVDGVGADVAGQPHDLVGPVAAPDHERRAERCQRASEIVERLEQEAGAVRPVERRRQDRVVEHEQRDDLIGVGRGTSRAPDGRRRAGPG